MSGTASESCVLVALSTLIQYLYSYSCLVYCKRLLENSIVVVPTSICGATPMFPGMFKGITGVIVLYHVFLLAPPRRPFFHMPRRYSMYL